jgi:putative transposase
VIDLATRMVVGWQLAPHMRTSLVVDALQMGIDAGLVHEDAIFHSDRGCQYTSREFTQFCQDKHVRTSLGRTGVCWDNAAAESFFAALKNEMYHRRTWPTRARARFAAAAPDSCPPPGRRPILPSVPSRSSVVPVTVAISIMARQSL